MKYLSLVELIKSILGWAWFAWSSTKIRPMCPRSMMVSDSTAIYYMDFPIVSNSIFGLSLVIRFAALCHVIWPYLSLLLSPIKIIDIEKSFKAQLLCIDFFGGAFTTSFGIFLLDAIFTRLLPVVKLKIYIWLGDHYNGLRLTID